MRSYCHDMSSHCHAFSAYCHVLPLALPLLPAIYTLYMCVVVAVAMRFADSKRPPRLCSHEELRASVYDARSPLASTPGPGIALGAFSLQTGLATGFPLCNICLQSLHRGQVGPQDSLGRTIRDLVSRKVDFKRIRTDSPVFTAIRAL